MSGSAEGFPERSKDFVLDVQQEETTMDGRKVKVNVKKLIKLSVPSFLLNIHVI